MCVWLVLADDSDVEKAHLGRCRDDQRNWELLTCLHRLSEAAAAAHLRRGQSRDHRCHRPAAERVVPTVGPHLTKKAVNHVHMPIRGKTALTQTQARQLSCASVMNEPPLFIKKVLEALLTSAVSNSLSRSSGGSRTHLLLGRLSTGSSCSPIKTE